jgi:acyl dehydratase
MTAAGRESPADRRSLVGRAYELAEVVVDADSAAAYARAVDDEPLAHRGRPTAPAFYPVRLVAPLWRRIYQAPELRSTDQQVLHAEQRMRWHRPLLIGETVRARAAVTAMVAFGFSDAAIIECRLTGVDSEPIVTMESTLAVQGGSGFAPDRRRGVQPRRGPVAARVVCDFDADAPARYADAADDHNPLHLDDEVARSAGHPSRIVHGMCTLATGVTALVNQVRRDPDTHLAYLRARFSRRVLPESKVEYVAHETGAAATFVVTARDNGRPVLKNCWLRLSGDG